jgi:hypothetical protein
MLAYAKRVEAITGELLNCSALNYRMVFARLILPRKYWLSKDFHEQNVQILSHGETVWSLLHVFEEGTPIRYSLDYEFKLLLASPAVASVMEFLFYQCTKLDAR